ncbi:MAG: valine--tRNA ligase [Candidatus Omnitrophica bacterium 4484_70.2]|nr:MAG: valine--tRNA ligase [Candidatus Omnitrophica bacterium 4484_70.2]
MLETKYQPKRIEENIYKFWLEKGYFSSRINPDKKPFTILIPPPNITGILHMGHALNNTLQDILIRFKRMQGWEVLWMPGTDHAGIATQNVVERNLAKKGLRKEDIGKEEFIKLLWEWRRKYGNTIIEQLKKLGASCDWQRLRFTMDEGYCEAVKEAFVRLYKKGLIYQGEYIINWCPHCRTALSDEESPYNEIEGWLYYLRYPVRGSSKFSYIVVATTRPETMLADTGIAFNPQDERYKWLKEVEVILPLVGRKLKVIEDEMVEPTFGTGVVKVTPAHDPQDFMLGKKYNLEFINIMNDDATLNKNAGEFAGLERFLAREKIIERLKREGLFEKKEPYRINARFCYRCDTLVEPRLSLQWFVKMKPLAEGACEVVEKDIVKFYPSRWKKVYLNWMYNICDWCISRQIWWGHRIPAFFCKECGKIIVEKDEPEKCPFCGSPHLVAEEDVLDTWFSSWLWPIATFWWPFFEKEDKKKEFEYFYPTQVLVTASEILFFWVARMIMAGLEFTGKVPFYDVIIHGTVRDEEGRKMSKSLGNIIDPLEIIEKFGADSLRFSLTFLCAHGGDVYLSDEKFLVGRNFTNKIWNATRFILMKKEESNIKIEDLEWRKLTIPDRWILTLLNQTIEEVTSFYENYRFAEAAKKIYEFFWHIFCDWYLEISKDNLNQDNLKILLYVLINTLKLLHPVMPFITENIFQKLKKFLKLEEAIIIAKWPQKIKIDFSCEDKILMEEVIEMIRQIRNLKLLLNIAHLKTDCRIKTSLEREEFLRKNIGWIKRLANLGNCVFGKELKKIMIRTGEIVVELLIDNVDKDKIMQSLEKKVDSLERQITILEKRLKDENFLKKASSEVVFQHKERLKACRKKWNQLKEWRENFSQCWK